MIGPFGNSFYEIKITSIHKKQIPSDILLPNEYGSFVITFNTYENREKVNKHMMILSSNLVSRFCSKFKIKIDNSNWEINDKHLLFINNIKEYINIININENIITVCFTNKSIIRYIKTEDKIIIQNNNCFYYGNII